MTIDFDDLVAPVGVAPRVGQLALKAKHWQSAVGDSEDLRRVLALPRRPQPDERHAEALIRKVTAALRLPNENLVCNCKKIRPKGKCITKLNLSQAWALWEIYQKGGLLGGIGVGHGKTILGILAALVMKDCKTAVLLVPPGLVSQLKTEYRLLAEHWKVPSLVVHGKDWSKIVPGAPVLHVLPYSRLSRPEASALLNRIKPDFIIADECHKLKDKETSTTSRVLRYFSENFETCRFAGWTGSLTDKGLKDYGHLAKIALREGSPLPLKDDVLDEWARAIDPVPMPLPAGALFQLCEPGEEIRKGYSRRLTETLGAVLTRTGAIDTPLHVVKMPAPRIPDVVADAMAHLKETWTRPDGEELTDILEVATSARQLACGFFYRWKFINGETDDQILKWLELRKAWNKELREIIRPRRVHLDSRKLVEDAAERFIQGEEIEGLPNVETEHWVRWRDVAKTVNPITEAVRLDPYLAQHAADWGRKNLGVIWYSFDDFAKWVHELSGLPLHGGGPKCGPRIAREKGDRSIIASIKAHGTGRDGLQHLFSDQLITTPPGSATAWEQLLGRLHRQGQEAKEVWARVYLHTDEFRASLGNAKERSLYVQETLGSEQKLQTGIDPM